MASKGVSAETTESSHRLRVMNVTRSILRGQIEIMRSKNRIAPNFRNFVNYTEITKIFVTKIFLKTFQEFGRIKRTAKRFGE